MKKLTLTLAAILFAASAFAQSTHRQNDRTINIDADADGFTLLGSKWAQPDIHYRVNIQSFIDCGRFVGITLDPALVLRDVQQAIGAWPGQTAAPLNPIYDGTTTTIGLIPDGVNTVSCTTDASTNGFIGQSSGSWYLDAQGFMVDADVLFWQGTYVQYPFVTRDFVCGNCLYILDTGTHEFGHFYGMGHSAETLATMYASTSVGSTVEETLYTDDIQGIETLYPDTVPPPPPPPPPPVCTLAPLTETVQNKRVSAEVSRLDALGYTSVVTVNLKKGNTRIDASCG